MNCKIDTYNVISPLGLGFSVSQCGVTKSLGSFVSSPYLYKNYILSFVVEGEGSYFLDGIKYKVCAGQGFLTTPNSVTNWTTADENSWKYIFVVLSGLNAKKLIDHIGFGNKSQIFDFHMDEEVVSNLLKILEICKTEKIDGYKVMAHFLLIAERLRLFLNRTSKNSISQNSYFDSALTYIDNNYMYKITVNDIAKHLNIERTYLYKIFIQQAGISPLKFLNKYRLKKAKEMMLYTNVSNETIAVSVGFYDYSHFSHKFRNEYGITPGEYRNGLNNK